MVFLTNFDLIRASQKYNIPLIRVLSKDELEGIKTRLIDGGYIINLQDSMDSAGNKLDGTHWVAMYLCSKPRYGCYLDPFGFQPPVEVQHILNRYLPYDVNRTQIQSLQSGICGYYCIYFLWYMTRAKTKAKNSLRFKQFISEFDTTKPTKNRMILDRLLENVH